MAAEASATAARPVRRRRGRGRRSRSGALGAPGAAADGTTPILDEGPDDDEGEELGAEGAHLEHDEHHASHEPAAAAGGQDEGHQEPSTASRLDAEERASFSLFSWLRRDPPRDNEALPAPVEPAPKPDADGSE